jgi:KDO2-lipid IV(A) lauroyltransferase
MTDPNPTIAAPSAPPRGRALRRRIKRLRRDLAYFLVFLPPIVVISRLPLGLGRFLAGIGARIGYVVARKERELALDNLRQAFPDMSENEVRRICRDNIRLLAWTMVEFLIVRRWSFEKIDRVFQLRDDFARLHEASRDGVVAVTAHFGNWELLSAFSSVYMPEHCAAVARTVSNHRVHGFIERARQRFGTEIIYTDDSPRQLVRALREKKLLGLLPDQNLRSPSGIFVPFFGRLAYTSTIPINLARSTQKNVVYTVLEREGKGFRLFLDTVVDEWTSDREADLRTATEAWSRLLEERVRKSPSQWVWLHDRWQTQPGDEKKYVEHNWVRKTRKQRE